MPHITGDSGTGDRAAGSGGGQASPAQASGGHHSSHSRVPGEEGLAGQGLSDSTVSVEVILIHRLCTCIYIDYMYVHTYMYIDYVHTYMYIDYVHTYMYIDYVHTYMYIDYEPISRTIKAISHCMQGVHTPLTAQTPSTHAENGTGERQLSRQLR